MICYVCSTSPVQPKEFVLCMGTTMKTNTQLESQSLLPAECLVITASISSLLTAIGSLLLEHPDLQAGLTPKTGQTLIKLGEKLNKVGTHSGT
jgi:hypothetical protein